MSLKLDNPSTLSPPLGLYSHTVEVPAGARLIFVSGQVGVKPDGSTPTSLEDQADQVYTNIVAALAAKNVPPSNIIKLTTFMVDDDPGGLIRKARAKYLGNHRPASTAVYVTRLVNPAWKVEIEAIAMVPENH